MSPTVQRKIEQPGPDPFAAEAGDSQLFRVRHISVEQTDDAAVRDAFVAVAQEAFRLAPENLDESRSLVLFSWDSVYSTLTVTFTDATAQHDASDVLKLFCTGWDRQLRQAKDESAAESRATERERKVYDWLEVIARQSEPSYSGHFPGRTIRLGFTSGDAPVRLLGEKRTPSAAGRLKN